MSIKNFSAYSLDAGALSLDDILNQEFTKTTNLAFLTDHNTLIGVPAFMEKAKAKGVKPIVGVNLSIEDNGIYAGDITLYAKNRNGLKSLQKIVSESEKDKNKNKVVDIAHVLNNTTDVIALTGGHNSILQKALSNGRDDYAAKNLYELKKCFNEDLYFEIQKTTTADCDEINKKIIKLAEEFNSPIFATNNNRMRGKAHYPVLLEKARKIKGVDNKDNVKLKDVYLQSDYIKSKEQLQKEFQPYAKNISSLKGFINKFENYEIFQDIPELPDFPGVTEEGHLFTVLRERYNEFLKTIPKEKHQKYHERIKYETDLVKELGFEKYFVLFLQIEKNKVEGQRFNVRGSAVSFLMTHVLGLSDVDPVENKLLAERFLNRNRLTRHELPDIDIESNNIEASYSYLAKTFGVKNTAYLSANSKPKAKGQIELAMNSLRADIEANPLDANGNEREFPEKEFNLLIKYVGSIWGSAQMSLAAMLKENSYITKKNANWIFDWKHDFKDFNTREFNNKFYKVNNLEKLANEYPKIKSILGYTRNLDAAITANGISYASVVVANNPISDYFSTQFVDGNYDSGDKSVKIAIEATKKHVEKLGLVKLDILSNKYLDKLSKSYDAIPELDIASKDYNDPEVYKMISRGYTATLNQIKSNTQREAAENIGVNNFNELVALLSLIRPAVKKDQERYIENKNNPNLSFSNEIMDDIFSETYGVLVFEEQIMEMAQKVAGYSREESDDFRSLIKKVCNNKNKDKDENYHKLESEKERFAERAYANGMPENVVKECSEILNNIDGYAFSKAHSLSYSALTYKQALVDAKYPGEYIEHYLISDNGMNVGNNKEFDEYLEKTAKFERGFLTLDINRSENTFKTRVNTKNNTRFIDPSIRFVLKDQKISDVILEERAEGPFLDIFDFVERTYNNYVCDNKGFVLEGYEQKESQYKMFVNKLIDAGAFDKLTFEGIRNLEESKNIVDSLTGNKDELKCLVRGIASVSINKAIDDMSDPFDEGDYKFYIPDNPRSVLEINKIEENTLGYSISNLKKITVQEKHKFSEAQKPKKPINNRSRNRP